MATTQPPTSTAPVPPDLLASLVFTVYLANVSDATREHGMNRVFLAAAVAPLLAGCAASAAGAQQPEPAPRTITVSASASVERAPDQSIIRFAVETEGRSAREASEANATAMAAVLAALEAEGIGAGEVRTAGLGVAPEYTYRTEGQRRQISGYRASNRIRVTVSDLEATGRIIDRALAAGANRVDGVSFSLSDPEAARLEALRSAVERAQAEAATVAEALGEPLGEVLSVSISQPGRYFLARPVEAARAAPEVPVEPGPIEVNATVTVVYSIGRP